MHKDANQQRAAVESLHVNLYGAGGFGKSGVAELLCARLRICGVSVELVREYSKELHWAGSLESTEQFCITAEQYRRQAGVHSKVQVVITDSAIPLGLLHAPDSYREALAHIVRTLTVRWNSLHVLLERDIEMNYSQIGRAEDALTARAHHHKVAELARCWAGPSLLTFDVDSEPIDSLIELILDRISHS
jgi:hypothetical protein